MAHLPQTDLQQKISNAAEKVRIGAVYSHYKQPRHFYKVIQLGILEETGEVGVIYEPQYGKRVPFIRSLSNWLEEVDQQGIKVPRFKLATT